MELINNDRTGLLGKIYFTVIEMRAKISNRLWIKIIKSYVLKKKKYTKRKHWNRTCAFFTSP